MVQKFGTILIVEDNEEDALLLRKSLQTMLPTSPVQWVSDGNEAILYLCGDGRYSNRAQYPLPALMLLDLKMPIKNGFEVLRFARSYPAFAAIPIIVHSDCFDPRIVKRAYELGANSFLRKPTNPQGRLRISEALKSYWLDINTIPQDSPAYEEL